MVSYQINHLRNFAKIFLIKYVNAGYNHNIYKFYKKKNKNLHVRRMMDILNVM